MSQLQLIFEKQWLHLLLLTGLITGLVLLGTLNSFQAGNLWDVGTMIWFRLAVAIAIAHQVWVWFCWRTQLHLSLLTRLLGDNGFTVYAVLFSICISGFTIILRNCRI
jgi:multisubunit Na+/H+ antiporter MnhE subunit